MKEVWVLCEKTDLNRGGEWDYQNYRSECKVFSSFEAAKTVMRKRIVELNSDGILTKELKKYEKANDMLELNRISSILNDIGSNDNFALSINDIEQLTEWCGISSISADFEEEGCADYMLWFGITRESEPELICHGYDDGPCNGVNPYIYINCFSMNDPEKKYSFHFEDMFNEDQCFCSHIFIDLYKTEIHDKT